MILTRVIKIWYIKNDNYKLILKNYSTYGKHMVNYLYYQCNIF